MGPLLRRNWALCIAVGACLLSFVSGVLYGRYTPIESRHAAAVQPQQSSQVQAAQATPVSPKPAASVPAPQPAPPDQPAVNISAPATVAPLPASDSDQVRLAIQIASLSDPTLANQHKQQLVRQGLPAFVEPVTIGGADERYRVLVGPYASRADADAALRLVRRDPRFSSSFVRPY